MKTIVLISCTKKKDTSHCKAEQMYSPSALLGKALNYARRLNPTDIYILSAKYGLLRLDKEIELYERTLNNISSAIKKQWAQEVYQQISQLQTDKAIFLAGENYRKDLIPLLERQGITCEVPLKGMGIGDQLGFYTKALKG